MELKIKNEVLQKMLSKSVKCSNQNIPLAGMLELSFDGKELTVTTFDGNTYMYVKSSDVVSGDKGFKVVVQIGDFADKIQKLSASLESDLKLDDRKLQLKSGRYSTAIELPLNSEGKKLSFPNAMKGFSASESYKLTNEDVSKIVSAIKGSLCKDNSSGDAYMNYLFSDCVLGTDSEVISLFKKKIFNSDRLVSPKILDLILLGDGDVNIDFSTKQMKLSNDSCTLLTNIIGGVDNFNKSLLDPFINRQYDSFCEVKTSGEDGLKYAINLLTMSVKDYDRGLIEIKFGKKKLTVKSLDGATVFDIDYISSDVSEELEAKINISLLKSQLATVKEENVKILFTDERSICLDCGNIQHIISLS